MDDSCAVCAESLEWVAYGACGHKDVCSTCVARLRFICDDRRCCICKTEAGVVFVTKALGDYTKTISDFSLLPSEVKEGRVGQYWYHEDTQALFDDLDHYKMIKAMCRLSCSVCDKMEDQPDDGPRRRTKFRNIEQLKGHLFHKHRLLMCSLCLEGRKVFICEQKLYTRSQLTQHINTGDSEVDGSESERGGFAGHPMCEFCRTPFYGDNELYTHMSTEHYTCHICQRQHPGQYEYYKNYDDLEMHFRRDHFLCEDEGCLAKKFTVFQSEAELKIPTSFRYRRSSEQENRRGRARTFLRDPSDSELSLAIQASLETASAAPSSSRATTDHEEVTDVESLIPPLESIGTTDSDPPSRYLQALSQRSRSGALGESSFPPLPVASPSNQNSHPDVVPKKTMAAHLRRQGNRKVNASSSGPAWPAASRTPAQPVINPQGWPSINAVSGSSSSSGQNRVAAEIGPASSSYLTSAQARPASNSSFAGSVVSSRTSGSTGRISHSSSAPNLSEREFLESSSTDFPPVSAAQTHKSPAQTHKSPASDQAFTKVDDVHTANKSLVEKIRAALGFDEDKFSAFKDISGEYRQGSMDAETYLAYVEQFGLSHLVLDMARLLPNAQKQKELIEAYNVNMSYNASRENGWSNGIKDGHGSSKKGKGKSVDAGKGESVGSGNSTVRNNIADNVMSTVKELQSSFRASEEEVEVLSKDGYRGGRGKSKAVAGDSLLESSGPGESTKLKNQIESLSAGSGANQNSGNGDGKSKQRKKTSKFHRVRLGDGSVEALLHQNNTDPDPDPGPKLKESSSSGPNNPGESLPARGVWRNGGGQKLFAVTSKGPKN
ncbi:E3 ubiquitin-protein ligase hel2 [Sesamum alatum]|uniref:RING-type E3 ubiquitin transferase n=1 Tax=Sesamum alatum TaxID=300844 RepID=A0AAE1XUU0_9LAMI|nr:E3 ubiquitin-protein ligase hel2 [Sesamum alatum]